MKTVMALIAVLALAGCSPEASNTPPPSTTPKVTPPATAPAAPAKKAGST